jgi:hypothetical protein
MWQVLEQLLQSSLLPLTRSTRHCSTIIKKTSWTRPTLLALRTRRPTINMDHLLGGSRKCHQTLLHPQI